MARIESAADLIEILEKDEGIRRDVAQWLVYRQPAPISDDALRDADPASIPVRLRDMAAVNNDHEARLRFLEGLSERVIALQEDADARHRAFQDDMRRHAAEMRSLGARYNELQGRLGNLRGAELERRLRRDYRRIIVRRFRCSRVKLIWMDGVCVDVSSADMAGELESRIDAARDGGFMSDEEYGGLMSADIIARGILKESFDAAWFVGEASGAIEERDIRRARSRAEALASTADEPASAFVYGWRIDDSDRELAGDLGVAVIIADAPDAAPMEAVAP